MSARARAAMGERDANHSDIADRYRAQMCLVLDLSTVGGGCSDTLVRIPTRQGGILQLVEIKTLDGKLSPSQERFTRDWGSVAWVVRTIDDVDNHVQIIRRMYR